MKNTIWNDFGIPAVRIGLTSINIAEAAKRFAGGYGGYDPRQKSGFVTARSQLLPHQWSKKAAHGGFFRDCAEQRDYNYGGGYDPRAGTTRGKSQAGTTRGKSQGLLRRGHSFYLINGRKKPPQRLFSRLRGDVLSTRICEIALPQNEIIAQGSPAHIHNLDSARRGRPRPTGRMT